VSDISILLLTEDGSNDAHDVLAALTERMLRLVDPSADLRKVRFEPANERARAAVAGYSWRSRKPRDHQHLVDLRQAILTKLGRDEGYVVVHLDGDLTWSESMSGEKHANRPLFEQVILGGVLQHLDARGQRASAARILFVSPYYSIEAWLFQNSGELARIYAEHHAGNARDLDCLSRWREDPSLLDEVPQIKEALQIKSQHNLRLATRSFPAAKVREVGKSFARAVADLEGCTELREALSTVRYHYHSGE
jgi:hypothetical protein